MTSLARDALEKSVPVRRQAVRCIRRDADVLPLFRSQILKISQIHWASFVEQANRCAGPHDIILKEEDMKFELAAICSLPYT